MNWLKNLFAKEKEEATPITFDMLQGKWHMVSLCKNGNEAPPAYIAKANIYFVIKTDQYAVFVDGEMVSKGKLTLNSTANPVQFDQHITKGDDAGESQLGIIRFRDSLLENCQGDKGDPRPKNFSSTKHPNASLACFKKMS